MCESATGLNPHTRPVLRTTFAFPRTRSPRIKTGTMIERVGSSTFATYVVATRRSRHTSPSPWWQVTSLTVTQGN